MKVKNFKIFSTTELIKNYISDLFLEKKLRKMGVVADEAINMSDIAEMCRNATMTRGNFPITESGIYFGEIDNIIQYLNSDALTIIVRPSDQNRRFNRVSFSLSPNCRKGSITDAFLRFFELERDISSFELARKCIGQTFYFKTKNYILDGQKHLALIGFLSASEIDCMMDIADDGYEGSFAILEDYEKYSYRDDTNGNNGDDDF